MRIGLTVVVDEMQLEVDSITQHELKYLVLGVAGKTSRRDKIREAFRRKSRTVANECRLVANSIAARSSSSESLRRREM